MPIFPLCTNGKVLCHTTGKILCHTNGVKPNSGDLNTTIHNGRILRQTLHIAQRGGRKQL